MVSEVVESFGTCRRCGKKNLELGDGLCQSCFDFTEDVVKCKYCGSGNVVRYGMHKSVQNYFCNDCQTKFVKDTLHKCSRASREIVRILKKLYAQGLSEYRIAQTLRLPGSTTHEWIGRYVPAKVRRERVTEKAKGEDR